MGGRMKDDQQRVKNLLQNTVTLLCEKGLAFESNLRVQGLLGITVDDSDVFVVHINELVENSFSRANPYGQRAAGPPPQQQHQQQPHPVHQQHPPAKIASPIFPLASISAGAPIKRGRGRPKGSFKKPRLDAPPVPTPPPVQQQLTPRRTFRAAAPPPPPPPVSQPPPEPCIVIKPEPLSDDPDLDEMPPDLRDEQEEEEAELLLPVSVMEQQQQAESHTSTTPASSATTPVLPSHPRVSISDSASEDEGGGDSELNTSEPFITGLVPNVAESGASTSWGSPLGGVAGVSARIAQSTIQAHNSPSSRGNGCRAVLRMSDVERANCQSCQQYVRRVRYNGERQRLKRKGVPDAELPKFAEDSVAMDADCATCEQRKAYFRERSHLHEQRKRTKRNVYN